jgi:hypothetical protein
MTKVGRLLAPPEAAQLSSIATSNWEVRTLVPEGEREQGPPGSTEGEPSITVRGLDDRLRTIEAAVDRLSRRQVVAGLRSNPADLLAGVGGATKIVRQDVDELAELLARWDLPLSPTETQALRGVALLAQAALATGHASLHLVVDVVVRSSQSDLEKLARATNVLVTRSRRAVPVMVTLHKPGADSIETARNLGIELVVDP